MGRGQTSATVARRVVDAETRVREDHHLSLRLWLRMLACSGQIESRIRQRLQIRFRTTLPRFDLMAQLERAPRGMTMSELSQRLMVTRGNITGITDGLERDGLVLRVVDAEDRRIFRVRLTAEGERQFRRMAAEHEHWIVDLFSSLSVDRKKQLASLLSDLKQSIAARPTTGAGGVP
jgi:DNA-binding MarR family transcriptional regulator